MTARNFAMILGVVFIVVGILGFIPGINAAHNMQGNPPPPLIVDTSSGYLLKLFHVNVLHNLVHGLPASAAERSDVPDHLSL